MMKKKMKVERQVEDEFFLFYMSGHVCIFACYEPHVEINLT